MRMRNGKVVNGWTPNREELAWAAGFFDGEGHVGFIHTKNTIGLLLEISQAEKSAMLLDRFKMALGGAGKVTALRQEKRPNAQPQARFVTQSPEYVQFIIAAMWCFLGLTKREQAQVAFLKYNSAMQFSNRAALCWIRGKCRNGHDLTLPKAVLICGGIRRCRKCDSVRCKTYRIRLRERLRRQSLDESMVP